MKNLYLFNLSLNLSTPWGKGQCFGKKTFFLCLLGLFFNLTAINAQPCAAGDGSIIACAGTMIDISQIGDSDVCSSATDCNGLSTEFLVVSSGFGGVGDTVILGTEQTLEFEADKYMDGGADACINVIPICYDLAALQDLVDNMNQNDTCCFFLNLITEQVAPPGTDSICNVIKSIFTSGDQIQDMNQVLEVIEVFGGSGLTLSTLQAVIDGVNAEAGFIANFCTQAREIGYCMNPDVDFTQNNYALVNPIPADPIFVEQTSCPSCSATESLAGYEPDGSAGTWTGGDVTPGGDYTTCGIGAGGQDYTYTYQSEDINGCFSENTVTVTVSLYNVDPIIFVTDEVVACSNDGMIDLTAATSPSLTGGDCAWGSPANAAGMVDVTALDGDYLVEYTCTDANGCAATGAITLTVEILDQLAFDDAEICPNTITNLNDLYNPPYAGTWSPSADIDGNDYGQDDVVEATYTYTDGNGCSSSATALLTVTGLEVNNFVNNPLVLTVGEGMVDLTGAAIPSIPDGTWSGANVMNGAFDTNVGQGTYTVSYSWLLDGFNCPGSMDLEVIVLGPLPIAFIDFSGMHKDGMNQLNWAVSTDIKVKDFVVQRSADGTDFESIHRIEIEDFNVGAGYFSFEDDDLKSSMNYYRILGVETDGTESYSKIIALESERVTIKEELVVAPNPLTDQVQINFFTATEATVQFTVVNAVGMQITSFVQNTRAGQNSFARDLSALDGGVYFLIANIEDRAIVTRILKY